jgi:hypothetical protein
MDDNRIYKSLDGIWCKVNETRCAVATRIEKTDELKRDLERLSEIPPRMTYIDIRLKVAEKAIEAGRNVAGGDYFCGILFKPEYESEEPPTSNHAAMMLGVNF